MSQTTAPAGAQHSDPVDAPVPIVQDLTLRISAAGDFFGLDFRCRDGAVRSAAFPTPVLVQLLTAGLWAAGDAGRRREPEPLTDDMRLQLRAGAPRVSEVRVAAVDGQPDPLLELRVGPVTLAVRLPRRLALQLAEALVTSLDDTRGPPGPASSQNGH